MTSPPPAAGPAAARMFFGFTVAGESSPMPLHAVAADSYRPCSSPECAGDRDEDFHTVTVYTLTEPVLPWWTTVEIHLCQTGHALIVARPTAAELRPVPPPAETDCGGDGARMFEVVSADGRYRSVLDTIETDNGYDCQICRRPWGMAWYELSEEVRAVIPEWFTNWLSLELHWCDGCGHGQIKHHSFICMAASAPPAVDR
ncbi:hypothetical protein [Nocardia sp. alder85J]|uniref:hypothetical protein n=1 Tax=Nocardia sp. alder85J TaxID=2862949 RepID=UPI001CD54DEE|nr:hypothetical protein [Nocardia sp. alder85J]MCX4095071.1 hypothetical protein [Nocardia sp. alder85J]